jgi:hypothetical protein
LENRTGNPFQKGSMEGITETKVGIYQYMSLYKVGVKQQQEAFFSFINDFSRKTWIYFLYEKSEAFTMFKTYKACVEKETSVYLKC